MAIFTIVRSSVPMKYPMITAASANHSRTGLPRTIRTGGATCGAMPETRVGCSVCDICSSCHSHAVSRITLLQEWCLHPAVLIWGHEHRIDTHVLELPLPLDPYKVIVVTPANPHRLSLVDRCLEKPPGSHGCVAIDGDHLVGQEVDGERQRCGEPLLNGITAVMRP